MNRRGFLQRLIAAPIAALMATTRPVAVAAPVASSQVAPTLQFHPDAFAMVAPPISIRVVRQFEISADRLPTRFDVLYGVATIRPAFAVRVVSA